VSWNGDPICRALDFATSAHAGQTRKYTGEPYIVHPIAVEAIVRDVPGASVEMSCAALLHDVVEDCGVTVAELRQKFGRQVADLVWWLTDCVPKEAGNRAVRKAMERTRVSFAPPEAQTIKLADLIDNTLTIRAHDPDFWKVYRREKQTLLYVLINGDQALWQRAMEQARG
jgi:(p)ppGpp synthase/HD superfamily hydrolase